MCTNYLTIFKGGVKKKNQIYYLYKYSVERIGSFNMRLGGGIKCSDEIFGGWGGHSFFR